MTVSRPPKCRVSSSRRGFRGRTFTLIESYKNSEEYKRNPEYANGMMDAWKAMHADLLAETAEVRAMIDGFE